MPALTLPGPTETSTEQIRRWVEEPTAFWEDCVRRFGPLVSLNLGSLGPTVLVADPETVRGIFQLPRDSFVCAPYNEHYRFVMGERSVLVQDGEDHRREKPRISHPLRREPIHAHAGSFRDLARTTAASWPQGEAFDPRPSFHDFTFQVVVHLLLGDLRNPTSRTLIDAYRAAVLPRIGGSWGPWQGFRQLHDRIRLWLAPEIAARRADPTRAGSLSDLVRASSESDEDRDDLQIADHAFTLMVAGVDTTALSLTWALHWLTRTPAAMERLCGEIDGVASTEPETLFDLPYLQAVFQETLRMYPVVPTPTGRKLTREVEIAGRQFPAGLTLVPCTYLVHRREELYPEPAEFRPERFLDFRPESHHYFPFGGGVRTCVGEQLARVDFKLGLSAVLSRWTLTAVEAGPVVPVRHGTMLAPSGDFRLIARQRRAATA